MSTASKHSPLLALPKELRLMIYDELFTPLIQRPEHFDTYVLPSEWPKIDFTPYRALSLTCKEVKEEATTHFDGHFLGDVMVFFDNVANLASFYFKIENTRSWERLANIRACLHTLPHGIEGPIAPETTMKPALSPVHLQTHQDGIALGVIQARAYSLVAMTWIRPPTSAIARVVAPK
ncbi:hypothetical protein KC343_g6510 [Hortaea werneckii]|nr:hypothetical protein KC323_g5123 [Hortaea werneckii]KAI6866355.1 hypothetical protein KC338_g4754 [Hortaea werneckii]KAI7208969.1 hypothetical protein KC352_g17437 [Hortaea werneckii]KAI7348619.1 hypothetical protein KC320_g6555 [Hortaea werneckii]KAI7561848.1 hypothetical protein KC317_g8809 [Hortaea werneckii]